MPEELPRRERLVVHCTAGEKSQWYLAARFDGKPLEQWMAEACRSAAIQTANRMRETLRKPRPD